MFYRTVEIKKGMPPLWSDLTIQKMLRCVYMVADSHLTAVRLFREWFGWKFTKLSLQAASNKLGIEKPNIGKGGNRRKIT